MGHSAAVNHASEIKIKVLPSFAATPHNGSNNVEIFSNSNGQYSEVQSPMLGVNDQQNKLQAQAMALAAAESANISMAVYDEN
jgi:hypothetical protein